MPASLFGFFFGMVAVLTAAVVLLTGLPNISTIGNGRHYPRPATARTVTVELQRHSPVAKEASPAKDVSPVVSTAKADTKQIKHYKPKLLARQRNNYGNARGYASGYGPSSLFSADPAHVRFPPPCLSRNWTLALLSATTTGSSSPTSYFE
jgi:hypothetical protein